ncbi:MAG: hypothetical protein QXT63_03905, partial [Thermoplasmata archaeon]
MKNKSKIRAYASVMAWHFSHLHLKYLHIRNSQMKKSFSILIILIILFSSLLSAIFYPPQTEENRKEFYVPPEEENKSSQYISHSIYLYPYSHYSEFRNSDNETCSETGGLYLIDLEEIAGRGIQPSEILEGSGEVTLEVMADRGPASSGSYIQEPRNINPYVYGQNYVIRVIDWIYPRANKTLVELAKQIKPGILRFPGGNPADECYWDRYNTPGLDYDTAPAP